jgi:hypothetical protein
MNKVLTVMLISGFSLVIFNTSAFAQKLSGRPVLTKLPFALSEEGRTPMENTPVFFDSRLLLVANYRPSGGSNVSEKDSYLYILDMQSGKEIARFGTAHSFASAYVLDNELNVFALDFSATGEVWKINGIERFVTNDLKTWKTEMVIMPEGEEHLFNTSVCRDDKGYLMAYESDKPVQFCFRFARSKDLSKWDKIPGLTFTGEHHEYSACPVIRYHQPYYYVIYLHAPLDGHNGWISYMARSKNLENWELSPFNPILEAGAGEGKNNSDVDLLEYEGKTYLYYATGDQATWGTVRVAMYDGAEKIFFEKHFPANIPFLKISANEKTNNTTSVKN